MIKTSKRHWPLFIAILVLLASLGLILNSSIKLNHGHFGYPLDDIYIHMAMAKNVVLHSTWGIDRYEFASATSSPLWTLMISLVYLIFGINEVAPLIMNIIFGILLLYIANVFLKNYNIHDVSILISLLAIIFFTPLFPVILGGMEHVLHIILTILIIFLSTKMLTDNKFVFKDKMYLLIMAALLTFTRYEGLFLIFILFLFFVLRKRFAFAFLFGLAALLPIATYGIISVIKGWFFFPNSVLLKGKVPIFSISEIYNFFYQGYIILITNLHMLLILLAAIFLFVYEYYKQKTFWNKHIILLSVFIVIAILHVLFAGMGWVYRYEAYLLVTGFSVIVVVTFNSLPEKLFKGFEKKLIPVYLSVLLLVSILFFPYYKRCKESIFVLRYAVKNVYEQQYQMGLFLKQFYQGKGIAANDIGAINFLADIKCLDLWGLNNVEITKAKRKGSYSTQQIENITSQKNIKIAILYDIWFEGYGGLPKKWKKAGEWSIPDNVVCAGNTVAFYAVDSLETDQLKHNLKAYSKQLPPGIIQSGDYTQ